MNEQVIILRDTIRDVDYNEQTTERIVKIPLGIPYYIKTKYSSNMEKEKMVVPILLNLMKIENEYVPVIDDLTNKKLINYFDSKHIQYRHILDVDKHELILTYAFLSDKLTLYEICNIFEM